MIREYLRLDYADVGPGNRFVGPVAALTYKKWFATKCDLRDCVGHTNGRELFVIQVGLYFWLKFLKKEQQKSVGFWEFLSK